MTILKYRGYLRCNFCDNLEYAEITTSENNNNPRTGLRGHKHKVSSQVKCSKCLNYIPHKNEEANK